MTENGVHGPRPRPFGRGWPIRHVEVDRIDSDTKLRPIDEVWARDLGHRMLSEGQAMPIELATAGQAFRLVAGAHRLEAARQYRGLSPIEAMVLTPELAGRRITMLVADHRGQGSRPIAAPALAADIYALLGVAEAGIAPPGHESRLKHIAGLFDMEAEMVADLLDIHRRVRARVMAMLHDLPLGLPQLHALARLAPGEQEKVAYLLLGGAESVAEAVGQLPRRRDDVTPTPRIDAFIAQFEQMSLAEKEAALTRLRPLAPPSIAIRWTGH